MTTVNSPFGGGSVTGNDRKKLDAIGSILNKGSTGTLTVDEVIGQIINNLGQTDDCTLTLPAADEGLSFIVVLSTTVAKFYRLTPNASDKILLDGSPGANEEYVQIASCVQGATIQFIAFESATGVYDWLAITGVGNWQAE